MIIVTNTNDSGAGSLRQALADAGLGEEITFAGGLGTITITSAELLIAQNLTITGPATIVASGAFRVISIGNDNVTMTDLDISGGNMAGDGGGIYNNGGTIDLTDCVIHDCTAAGGGGGLFTNATAVLTRCEIRDNTGEGIYNSGTITLVECTVATNVTSANGFQIYNDFGGTVTLTRCTIHGDTGNAPNFAAIFSDAGTLTVENSTVSGHVDSRAFLNDTGSVAFTNSTITNNGVGFAQTPGSICNIYNTILDGNTTTDYDGDTADIISGGHNIFGASTNPITPATGDQFSVADLLIGPLADNGGPTLTHALLPNSPALNAGNNAGAPTTDQRGLARIVADTIDIGAYEAGCLIFNGTLPEWITVEDNCLVGAAGQYSASTQEAANAAAQAALDAVVTAAQESEELVCQTSLEEDMPLNSAAYVPNRDIILAVRGGYVFKLNATTGAKISSARMLVPDFDDTYIDYDPTTDAGWAVYWHSTRTTADGNPPKFLIKIDPDDLSVVTYNFNALGIFPPQPPDGPVRIAISSGVAFVQMFRANDIKETYRFDLTVPSTTHNGALPDAAGSWACMWIDQAQLFVGANNDGGGVNYVNVADLTSIDFTGAPGTNDLRPYGICRQTGVGSAYIAQATQFIGKADVGAPYGFSTIDLGRPDANPHFIRYNPNDSLIYIPLWQDNTVAVLDPADDSFVIKTGFDSPFDVVFTPTKSFAVQHGAQGLKEIV